MRVIYVEDNQLDVFSPMLSNFALDKIEEKKNVITLGLLDNDEYAVGALSGFLFDDTFYITSLFVDPDYRENGGGTMLVDTLIESLKDEEIIICVDFMTEDVYTDSLASFFEALEFLSDDSGYGAYSANTKDIENDPIFTDSKYEKYEEGIKSISQTDKQLLQNLEKTATREFLPFPANGIFSENVDRDLSVVHTNISGKIDAYLIVDDSIEYMPTIAAIYNDTDVRILSGMLRYTMKMCKLKYPMNVEIAFAPVNGDSLSIMQKLAPDAKKLSYKYYTFPK